MKPAELFPGAVVMKDGKPYEIFVPGYDGYITQESGTWAHPTHISTLTPLPLSPAVLRGLGFEWNPDRNGYLYGSSWLVVERGITGWVLGDATSITHAHQLQSLALHLYGVELVWNQSEYETALKEERV